MKTVFVLTVIIAAMFMSCDSGNGVGGDKEDPRLLTIESKVYPFFDPDVYNENLNAAEVTAWVNGNRLPVTGTIEKGILRISLPEVKDAYLTPLKSYSSAPGIQTAIQPKDVKAGKLELKFTQDDGLKRVFMPQFDAGNCHYNYSNKTATLIEKADKVVVNGISYSSDVDLNLKAGWNIVLEESHITFDDNYSTKSMSIYARSQDKEPETVKWYYY